MKKEVDVKFGKHEIMETRICRGFDKSDINKKNQLIIEDGVQRIDLFDEHKDFEAEVDEIVLPESVEYISAGSFANIKAKCVNIPTKISVFSAYEGFFNAEALECIKITGSTVHADFFENYPNINTIIVENGSLLQTFEIKIPSHIEKLIISEECKKARIALCAFSSIGEIVFPKKFNSRLHFEYNKAFISHKMINSLSKENLLELLKYCPEIYHEIDPKTCDSEFISKAKDVIVSGMAARQQAKGYSNVNTDVEMLREIKGKMKSDEQCCLTPEIKFHDAVAEFYKD